MPGGKQDWMRQTLGKPASPHHKGVELAHSHVRAGGTVQPESDPGTICPSCGKVLSGPHTGESGGAESARTHEYKGHKYSSKLCEDCAPVRARDFRAEYMEYRRQHPKGNE